jgi:hypothetical protein
MSAPKRVGVLGVAAGIGPAAVRRRLVAARSSSVTRASSLAGRGRKKAVAWLKRT